MRPTLVVLAAGIGSRYGGIKQIDPVGRHGETIIDFSVYDAIQVGFDKIVFIIREEIEADFKGQVVSRFEDKIDIQYCYQHLTDVPEGVRVPPEREKPWGTGHAVLVTENYIEKPFAVINADDFYGRDALRKIADYLTDQKNDSTDFAMVGYLLKNTLSEHGTVSRGICTLNPENTLSSIVEHTKIGKEGNRILSTRQDTAIELRGDEIISMNLFGFTPAVFGYFKREFKVFLDESANDPKAEFYIPKAMNALINNGEAVLRVLKTDSEWFGVTYQADKKWVMDNIGKLVDKGVYPAPLWG